jgi:hypothetical protein
MELIEAVIDQWDAEEMQMEINFESKANVWLWYVYRAWQ